MALQPEGSYGRPYVENPNEHLKSVHWPSGIVPSSIGISWAATLITPPGDWLPPPYASPTDCVMNVAVDGLPALRSPLRIWGGFTEDRIPIVDYDDAVSGEFPDGASGTLSAAYFLRAGPIPLNGGAGYLTTAVGGERFGGVKSVSVSLSVTLFEVVGGTGYTWFASGGAGGAGSRDLTGEVGSGGSLSFRATVIMGPPPSFSFSGG